MAGLPVGKKTSVLNRAAGPTSKTAADDNALPGLPAGGKQEWPPKDMKHVWERYLIWRAWYRGDPEELAAVYGGGGSAQLSERRFTLPGNHPAQYRGGVVGAVARMWWGKPIPQSDYPSKLHIPAPEDLAVVSSQLLFAEPPQITWESEKTAKRMTDILGRSNLHAKLLQGAELQAPYGGVYMVITWDDKIAGHPWIRPVQADAGLPEFSWDVLTAVTFFHCVEEEDGGTVWRHLERHEPGRIMHALYKGSSDELGWPQPLDAHPKTARLPRVVETVEKRLTAAYVPNILPNRLDPGSMLGRSDYSPGVITLFDALDQTYTSLMNDLELGAARLVVPRSYLKTNGPGQGMRFDHSQRIYSPLDMLDSPERPATIEQVQFAIRVTDHLTLAADLHDQIVRAAGYSKQSVMGDESTAQATATEVNIRKGRTESTRDSKGLYWNEALANLLETLAMIDAAKFSSGVDVERPKINFNEEQQQDPLILAQTVQTLFAAEAASIETRVRMAHPGWKPEQVDEEVKLITEQVGTTMDKQLPPPGMGPIGPPDGLPGTNPQGTPKPKPTPRPGQPGQRAGGRPVPRPPQGGRK